MPDNSAQGSKLPDDLVAVGHVSGAYGIQGWIRITPYSAQAEALLQAKTWWLDKPQVQDVERIQVKLHSGDVVAQLVGIGDRDAAEKLKGAIVSIRRSHFPALSDDEFYWVDLVGLKVENLQGVSLGSVSGLIDNGVHPILRIEGNAERADAGDEKQGGEILIPYVEQYVKTVDREAGKITVDWGLDY